MGANGNLLQIAPLLHIAIVNFPPHNMFPVKSINVLMASYLHIVNESITNECLRSLGWDKMPCYCQELSSHLGGG